eukprot:TRINITY_DN387_c0_g1_i2.p1 TRINITY_DN387_c0_g1~~TRINITY_DN387_c0_g1_i2.p1  ORF type:complete len:212 (-),score=50.66 TRINITY_DN387_c0_g1_i2:441-1076(-)
MGSLCGKSERSPIRVMVLGTSGCGKSTFLKQMKILYKDGFEEFEYENFKRVIIKNLSSGLRELLKIIDEEDLEHLEMDDAIEFYTKKPISELTDEAVDYINRLWSSDCVKDNFYRMQYQLHFPSLGYYIENLERIVAEDYVPTEMDILRSRQATIGKATIEFIHNKYPWEIIDVGGQAVERLKWPEIMEGSLAVVFFVSLVDFNTYSGMFS